jgi:hypothetical protein
MKGHPTLHLTKAGEAFKKKEHHKVRQFKTYGEMLSTDSESSWKFREAQSLKADEVLLHEQLYSCDKSGLSFKMLLLKSVADHEGKSAAGYKRSKEKCDNICYQVTIN